MAGGRLIRGANGSVGISASGARAIRDTGSCGCCTVLACLGCAGGNVPSPQLRAVFSGITLDDNAICCSTPGGSTRWDVAVSPNGAFMLSLFQSDGLYTCSYSHSIPNMFRYRQFSQPGCAGSTTSDIMVNGNIIVGGIGAPQGGLNLLVQFWSNFSDNFFFYDSLQVDQCAAGRSFANQMVLGNGCLLAGSGGSITLEVP